jgi:hypothetical protein
MRLAENVMGKHGSYPRVDGDHYPAPDRTIAALAEHVDLAGKMVWEPCASSGQMAEALKAAGVTVFCSDIVDRGYPLNALLTFTNGVRPEFRFDGVVTNPAYGHQGKIAERSIEAGLHHIANGGFLALLLSADFDSGKTRPSFFLDCPLFAAEIVPTRRIVWFSSPNPKKENPKENHAWYIWRFPPSAAGPLISTRPAPVPPPFLKPRRPVARFQRR